jgi:6-phosphogluconate dehydrogenase (decarboxylating)
VYYKIEVQPETIKGEKIMSEQKPKIGFIGLGLMGSAMVQRLQSVGYELTVMAHRNKKPIDEAVARGAVEAADPAGVAQNATSSCSVSIPLRRSNR